MTIHTLKYLLIVFLLMVIVQEDVLGQRRGKKTLSDSDKYALEHFPFLKNICCNFVYGSQLTSSTRKAIYQDAYALGKEVIAEQVGDTEVYKNLVEEFVTYIDQDLTYIRIADSIELAELNNLAIRKDKQYPEYSTSITLDYTHIDEDWIYTAQELKKD